MVWQAPQWAAWAFGVNPRHYLTGPEREALIDEARKLAKGTPAAVTEFFDPRSPDRRGIFVYSWADKENPDPASAPTVADSDIYSWRDRHAHIAYRGWMVD